MLCTKPRHGSKWPAKLSRTQIRGGGDGMRLSPTFLFSLFFFPAAFCAAQTNQASSPASPPTPLISPEVHADGSVTFRFRAPNAKAVELEREGTEPQAMVQNDQGIWSLTTAPLAPD